MIRIKAIAFNAFNLVIKDKTSAIWLFLVPIFYILVFGSSFKYDRDPSQDKAYVAVYNQDEGFLGAQIIEDLRTENVWVDSLTSMPDEEKSKLFIIPPDFTQHVLEGKKTRLDYQKQSDANMEAAATVSMAIRKVQYRLLADIIELRTTKRAPSAQGIQEIRNRQPLVKLESEYAGNQKIIPSGFAHQLPANVVMFTMIVLFIYSSAILAEERKKGILNRVFGAPVEIHELFFGKLIGSTLVGFMQISVLLLAGKYLFGVDWGPSIPALLLLVLAFSMCCSAMGLCLGGLVKTEDKVIGISLIAALSMAALSGCWWPIEIAPAWNAKLASVLPSGIALQAFHQLFSYGNGFSAIAFSILSLFFFSIGFAGLFYFLLRKSRL